MDLSKQEFLEQAGWGNVKIEPLAGDASIKTFHRLVKEDGARAIFMEMPVDSATYSKEANLAITCLPFLAVGDWLAAQNISVPNVLFKNIAAGFILLEDFGDNPYRQEHLPIAVDILSHLHQRAPPEAMLVENTSYTLPVFTSDIYMKEIMLFIEWFLPFHNIALGDKAETDFTNFWEENFPTINSYPPKILLRDYHSPNFIHLPARVGLQGLGVLDYQDALSGPALYDLVSLLQDARMDIDAATEAAAIKTYQGAFDANTYALLGAQRALKILGIFCRFATDEHNPTYLKHLPRMRSYLTRNLAQPICAPLRRWFEQHAKHAGHTEANLMKIPQAFMLAAGLGTRMGANTQETPKPLLTLGGRAMMDHGLETLSACCDRVVINIHAHAAQMRRHLLHHPDMLISDETAQLMGTGGALRHAYAEELLLDAPCLIHNCDAIFPLPLEQRIKILTDLAAAFLPEKMSGLLLLKKCAPDEGDFALSTDNHIETGRGYFYTGIQILSPALFKDLPHAPLEMAQIWQAARAQKNLYGLSFSGAWLHSGTKEALAVAENKLSSLAKQP